MGSYAAAHQVAQHYRLAGGLGILISVDQRRILVKGVTPKGSGPNVLEQALRNRLVAGMAMDVDEAGHHHNA
jgi:hypothetical protein